LRISLTSLIVGPPLFAVLTIGGAHAALSPLVIPAVVKSCPIQTSGICEEATKEFLGLQDAGPARDKDIISLVELLATAAQNPNITRPQCIELQRSVRLLANGVSEAATKQQVKDIADALCEGRITASVGGGAGDSGPPMSLATPGTPTDNPPPGGGTPPPTGGEEPTDGDENEGSNDSGGEIREVVVPPS
jgi:hypothetical protein